MIMKPATVPRLIIGTIYHLLRCTLLVPDCSFSLLSRIQNDAVSDTTKVEYSYIR